jgi:hypothetical protein
MMQLFTYSEGSILLRLLLSHVITDFFLQPNRWVQDKRERGWKSPYLLVHALLAGALAWVFLWDVNAWPWALIIAVTHYVIDGIKLSFNRRIERSAKDEATKAKLNLSSFLVDQALHVLVLVLVWLLIIHGGDRIHWKDIFFNYRLLLCALGYLLVLSPAGYCIGMFTQRWASELNMDDSLKDVGKWIGMMERVIILTLILMHQYASIGFLITAKSLLRLVDKPDALLTGEPVKFSPRKHTEYVLVGTFLSFSVALFVGLVLISFLG